VLCGGWGPLHHHAEPHSHLPHPSWSDHQRNRWYVVLAPPYPIEPPTCAPTTRNTASPSRICRLHCLLTPTYSLSYPHAHILIVLSTHCLANRSSGNEHRPYLELNLVPCTPARDSHCPLCCLQLRKTVFGALCGAACLSFSCSPSTKHRPILCSIYSLPPVL
jgi:hypothetical protein